MLAVPALAFVMGWRPRAEVVPRRARWRAVAVFALWLALVVAFAAAYVAPAYTPDRPLRRYAQYQADHGARRAAWGIGSIEPGLDIHASGAPAGWRLASGPLLAGSPFGGMPLPFAFRADVTPSEPPVSAEGVITRTADEMNVQIRIAVADPGATPFVTLPAGVVPIRSSLPGRVREGAWTASYSCGPNRYACLHRRVPPCRCGTPAGDPRRAADPHAPGRRRGRRGPGVAPRRARGVADAHRPPRPGGLAGAR